MLGRYFGRYFGNRYFGPRYWSTGVAPAVHGRYFGRYFGGRYFGPRYWGTVAPAEPTGRYFGKYFSGAYFGPRYWSTPPVLIIGDGSPIESEPTPEEPVFVGVRHTGGFAPRIRIPVSGLRRQQIEEDELIMMVIMSWLHSKDRKL